VCARPEYVEQDRTICDNFHMVDALDTLTCTDMSLYATPVSWNKYTALTVDPMLSGR